MINIARKQHLDKHHLVNIDRLKIVLQEILAKTWHISYSTLSSLPLSALYLFPYFFDFHLNFVLVQRLLIVTNIQEIHL